MSKAATFTVADGDGTTFSGGGTSADAAWLLGGLAKGHTVSVDPLFMATAGPGTIDDTAVASAVCSTTAADGHTAVNVNVTGQGSTTVGSTVSNAATVAVTGGSTVLGEKTKLPATGATVPLIWGVLFLMAGADLLLYERRRRVTADARQ